MSFRVLVTFTIILFLLVITPKFNCRQINNPPSQEFEQIRIRSKFNSFFLKHFKTAYPYDDLKKKMHVVVRREVPTGPNALHN
ncbi:hypothetical protein CASFOL_006890 [Castilleja foliolosa]|uniref:Uncharacterized protein n=1 Tax=Castilleja foliolosa TaxID=1961234 RepID=A0ABD3E875_9LAMI